MTEKKLWTLTVDEEFKALIPPLSAEERQMLEESIIANGCEMPILVWNDIIVDGHNRYAICHDHGIPFAYEEREFETRNTVKVWMLLNQLGRRNLNEYQRSEMVLILRETESEDANRRMMSGKTTEDPGVNLRQGQKSKGDRSGRALNRLGKMAGVSESTMRKVERIVDEADEETKDKLRRGEMKIHNAYTHLPSVAKPGEKKLCSRCHQEKPLTEFTLPSNRGSYMSVCKDCEREVEQVARSAAKVASETTEPVETYPVQGMAMYKGHPIHIGSVPEDKPEMFSHVQGLLDFAVHGYLADVREAMKWFGPNMRTPENVEKVEALIMNTCESALKMLHENDRKDEQEKED